METVSHEVEQIAVFCSLFLSGVNRSASIFPMFNGRIEAMTPALFDNRGNRKYLIARERLAFVYAASKERDVVSTFCLTLAFTGARISEVLALTANRIDAANEIIIFETLKQRKRRVFRAVPVPRTLIPLLTKYGVGKEGRLWPWGRTNGWKVVKTVMRRLVSQNPLASPKRCVTPLQLRPDRKASRSTLCSGGSATRALKRQQSMQAQWATKNET